MSDFHEAPLPPRIETLPANPRRPGGRPGRAGAKGFVVGDWWRPTAALAARVLRTWRDPATGVRQVASELHGGCRTCGRRLVVTHGDPPDPATFAVRHRGCGRQGLPKTAAGWQERRTKYIRRNYAKAGAK